MKRIDIVGQNGNTGEHYLVEKVARILAGPDADQILMGKNAGKRRWELHLSTAMEVIEVIKEG